MRTIANKLRFALLLGFMAITVTVWGQRANVEKMSISTQMFLDQMEGKANFDEAPGKKLSTKGEQIMQDKFDRPFSHPDTIDGKVYISAFIRLDDMDAGISSLEGLGVVIQCTFDNGLLTALIPVDKVNEVADLDIVNKIEVATPMHPMTDKAREMTNADDVVSLSADAIAAGLDKKYDGTGVIIGVIDTGIDLQHIAFKDKDGNSRIKKAYVYNGSSATEYSTIGSNSPTTDDSSEDHGTHTSSAAGGSSVIIDGSSVTVTDDHANATYGGMAPGADLYLAAINGLNSTYIANAFQKIVQYATSVNKPVVVTNSWGSHLSPHDGTSSTADIVAQYFGDNYPNRICLFSAGNTSGSAPASEGGGCHLMGTASSSNPLRTIMRYYGKGGDYYSGFIASAWCRSTSVSSMGCRIYVLNTTTGRVLTSINVNPSTYGTTVSGLSNYYTGSLRVYKDYISSNKTQIAFYASSLETRSSNSEYTLAVELYPSSGEAVIDMWGGNYGYFTDFVTISGYNWVTGTDDGGMGDYATIPQVISIGAYVSKNRITDYNGTTYNYSTRYTVGDIANFSSYGTPSQTPTGLMYPWITAPGARTVAAVNHYHTGDDYSYIDGDDAIDRVNANTTYPYGAMQGTSMSTPVAAGIVALWLQVAKESNKNLTLSEVKTIMKETAIRDYYVTSGPNASHFGNGKIDALAGVQYILDHYATSNPIIRASESELDYLGKPGETYTQQVTVKGVNLTGPIMATLNDASNVFSMSVAGTSGLRADGQTVTLNDGDELNVSYSPTNVGEHTGAITLTSSGAVAVTITLNGTAAMIDEVLVCDGVNASSTLPVFGTYHDENQHNQMIYPARKFQGTPLTAGSKIRSMTFYPTSGTITNSNNYTYNVSGLNFYNGSISFKMANLPAGTNGFNESNPEFKTATFTEVKTFDLPTSPDAIATEWTIEFDEDFIYEGGDLLIDVTNPTVGEWGHTLFVADTINDIRPGYVHYETSQLTTTYLPKVTFLVEDIMPSLSLAPTEVNIEDGTGDARSATVTVNSDNLTDVLTTTVSNHWGATLNQDNSQLTVTYNGKALHQVGSASVHSNADDLHVNASADYLYTGPIYILGNSSSWAANNGIQMTRDAETGIYTATLTAQNSGDGYAYIGFTKRLGNNSNDWNSIENYRFGPVSNDQNWALYNQWADNRDEYCPLDTTGGYSTIQLPLATYRIIIDSKNNQFMIHELKTGVLTTNTETVMVYHSDLQVVDDGNTYTEEQIIGDVNCQLPIGDGSQAFNILVKGDEEITRYDLERKVGDNGSWTVVALARHEGNTFMPLNSDNSAQGEAVAMPDGTNEMWLPLKDNDPVANVVSYYVPVTVADGVVTTGNTYGAPIQSAIADKVTLVLSINGSKSDQRWGGHWTMNGKDYCVYTPVITIESNDFDPQVRRPYMFRAWLLSDDAWDFERVDNALTGTTQLEMPHPLGEYVVPADQTDAHIVIIGEDWDQKTDWNTKLDNAFAAPSINANLRIVVRAYYENVVAATLRDGEAKYRIAEQGTDGTFDLPTAVIELVSNREIVGVAYVNSLGQVSDQPFDGVNIIVTRYSDGSTTTTKVLK